MGKKKLQRYDIESIITKGGREVHAVLDEKDRPIYTSEEYTHARAVQNKLESGVINPAEIWKESFR